MINEIVEFIEDIGDYYPEAKDIADRLVDDVEDMYSFYDFSYGDIFCSLWDKTLKGKRTNVPYSEEYELYDEIQLFLDRLLKGIGEEERDEEETKKTSMVQDLIDCLIELEDVYPGLENVVLELLNHLDELQYDDGFVGVEIIEMFSAAIRNRTKGHCTDEEESLYNAILSFIGYLLIEYGHDEDDSTVSSPKHYELDGLEGVEVIDIIRSVLSKEGYKGFCEGNIIKYMLRARKKNGLEDHKKASIYQDWLIEAEEGE